MFAHLIFILSFSLSHTDVQGLRSAYRGSRAKLGIWQVLNVEMDWTLKLDNKILKVERAKSGHGPGTLNGLDFSEFFLHFFGL